MVKSNPEVSIGLTLYIFAVFIIIVIVNALEAQSLATLDNALFPQTFVAYIFESNTKTLPSYMFERIVLPLPFMLVSFLLLFKRRLSEAAGLMSIALFIVLTSNLLAYALKYGTIQM